MRAHGPHGSMTSSLSKLRECLVMFPVDRSAFPWYYSVGMVVREGFTALP